MNFQRLPIASAYRYGYTYEAALEYYNYLLAVYNGAENPVDPRPKLSDGTIKGNVIVNKETTDTVYRDSRPIVIGGNGWAQACLNDYTVQPVWESSMAWGKFRTPVKPPRTIVINTFEDWSKYLIDYMYNDNDLMQFLNRCGVSIYWAGIGSHPPLLAPIKDYKHQGGGNLTGVFGFVEKTEYSFTDLYSCPGGKVLFICDGERGKDTILAGGQTCTDWNRPYEAIIFRFGDLIITECREEAMHECDDGSEPNPSGNRTYDEYVEATETEVTTTSNATYADCGGSPVVFTTTSTSIYVSAERIHSYMDEFLKYVNSVYKRVCERCDVVLLAPPENFRMTYDAQPDKLFTLPINDFSVMFTYIRSFFAEDELKGS